MRTISVAFNNYHRHYTYLTNLNLLKGSQYKISTHDQVYSTPIVVLAYDVPRPEGIALKEITEAELVE